ncbi:MAG: hypothetical protein H6719_01470 [Sandaracinaceae bacterium]|nr:hypothetical protein [Sandaracinaceae bacterium]
MRLALALTIALGACSPPGPTECGTGSGSVEVGRGGSRIRSLPPSGGELDIVRGSQGGIHVLVGAWVEGMDLDLTLSYRLEEAGELVGAPSEIPLRAALFAPAGERYVRHPDLIVLDNFSPSVDQYVGRTVDLTAEAVSADGSHACDTRSVVLTDPGI